MSKMLWWWMGLVTNDDRVPKEGNTAVMLRVTEDGEYRYHVNMAGQMERLVTGAPERGALPWRCTCARPVICCHIRAVLSANWARGNQE